jgi:protein SCO1/2
LTPLRGFRQHALPLRSLAALIVSAIALILWGGAAFAQDPPAGVLADIGIDQKLNAPIPMDLMFRDELGRDVRIGEFFHHKPVILSLVYYECPMLCSMTLNGLVKSFRPLSFTVGNEFEVLTVSFDANEKPDLAAAKKSGYVKDYGRPGAASGWHFLTGSADSIHRLTEAVGYRYKWDEYTKQWAHVSAILVLTPDGRVSQYLYGIEFSARDVRLSLVQASQNKIGTIIDRALLYCYHYNPETGRYGLVIMNTVRLAGLATVAALALFIAVNVRRETS